MGLAAMVKERKGLKGNVKTTRMAPKDTAAPTIKDLEFLTPKQVRKSAAVFEESKALKDTMSPTMEDLKVSSTPKQARKSRTSVALVKESKGLKNAKNRMAPKGTVAPAVKDSKESSMPKRSRDSAAVVEEGKPNEASETKKDESSEFTLSFVLQK